jgi:hypothetical protein
LRFSGFVKLGKLGKGPCLIEAQRRSEKPKTESALLATPDGRRGWQWQRAGDRSATPDVFLDDSGRDAHLSGRVAEALMA